MTLHIKKVVVGQTINLYIESPLTGYNPENILHYIKINADKDGEKMTQEDIIKSFPFMRDIIYLNNCHSGNGEPAEAYKYKSWESFKDIVNMEENEQIEAMKKCSNILRMPMDEVILIIEEIEMSKNKDQIWNTYYKEALQSQWKEELSIGLVKLQEYMRFNSRLECTP